jgi:lactate dehydrogenase-like 2-hydroxyacid dehydrogenase
MAADALDTDELLKALKSGQIRIVSYVPGKRPTDIRDDLIDSLRLLGHLEAEDHDRQQGE